MALFLETSVDSLAPVQDSPEKTAEVAAGPLPDLSNAYQYDVGLTTHASFMKSREDRSCEALSSMR